MFSQAGAARPALREDVGRGCRTGAAAEAPAAASPSSTDLVLSPGTRLLLPWVSRPPQARRPPHACTRALEPTAPTSPPGGGGCERHAPRKGGARENPPGTGHHTVNLV